MIYKSSYGEPSIDKVGGKAFNLAHLDKNKMNVPAWFALTSDCFVAFLGEQREKYMSLLENYSEQNRIEILKLIGECEFSDELKQLVMSEIRGTFAPGDELSVRSSATDEDSEGHSFAGMMESYLNVWQSEDIFAYVKKCYLSCFSERIMEYRSGNRLINNSISVSVIIQRMVDADYAGVMFTSNPQTNDPDETLISVVSGTGEKLVSGTSDSSDYVIDFFGNVSHKSVVDGVDIDEKILCELYKIGQTIEKSYPVRRAQDIEFCIKDGEIYILQSRTITNYCHIDKSKFRTIYDNSNIIESYCGPTTPLTYSFAREVYAKVYNQTLKNFYIKQENIDEIQDDLQNMLGFYENKIYYRLNSWYKMTSLYPGYETNKKYMENMMGVKVSLNENKRQAKNRLVKIYTRFIYKLLRIKKDSKKFKDKFNLVTAPYYNNKLEGFSNEQLLKIYGELEAKILDDFIIPITNDMGTMVIYGMLTDKVKKMNIDNYEGLISGILSKQGKVESVGQSLELMEIIREIKADESLLTLFKDGSTEELSSQMDSGAPVFEKINQYIQTYGARSMDELKLETVTMQEDPAFLFEMIKQYLEINCDVEVYQPSEGKSLEKELYSHCKFGQKTIMKLLVSLTKFFIKNRESLRLRRTYIFSIVRNIFLRIGHNFESEEIIQNYRDIFYLTKPEIFQAIQNPGDVAYFKSLIAERKAEYEANSKKTIYERMYFYGDVAAENMVPIFSRQEVVNDSNILRGVAGGGSVVTGTVKLVTDPKDADVKGYILMAKRTDPGWTVLFPMADAIIIERGSVLSHSAVVAREMGLTLVVGVRGLTQIIKDGMRVKVDGVNGTIEILDNE